MVLGIIAAIASRGSTDEPIVQKEGDCGSCSSRAECKLADLKEDVRKKKEEKCHTKTPVVILLILMMTMVGCSTKKNTATNRWWHSFNARYNTYFNGSQAFIEGSLEKENGNHDDHTQLIPLYAVANKGSKDLGKGQFDRSIEKMEKAIRQHSIKARPVWKKNRRKTQKDIEWLNRREYNPFLWRAWLLMGKSQFQKGEFEEASATFGYMARLYQTQPVILARARAWQAKCYVEMNWLYEAEDLITKQRRDSIPRQAAADWDYTLADYYIRNEQWPEATTFLRKAIRHERRRKQRARMWFLMGQLEALQGHRQQAYDAYKHVIRLSPPYELEFNARISQSEVMATYDAKSTIKKLRRMAASDNNKDYLDQVYYAIGNVYLAQRDTMNAIAAYEKGNMKATRSGTEKGVLLLQLGNIYWQQEKYGDARRCYGEAIGLLDRDRPGYKELAERSKVLDELVPYTDAIHLQDSLQVLANMSEDERNKAIDRVIQELIRKEKEALRAQQEEEAEKIQQQIAANQPMTQRPATPRPTNTTQQSTLWYFYNPQLIKQGRQEWRRKWGNRPLEDNWRRQNKQVIVNDEMAAAPNDENGELSPDSLTLDSTAVQPQKIETDDHKPEYYLQQIPRTPQDYAVSDSLWREAMVALYYIYRDKVEDETLAEETLRALSERFPGHPCLADILEDLRLRALRNDTAYIAGMLKMLAEQDSLYAATYVAYTKGQYATVKTNKQYAQKEFPQSKLIPRFLFLNAVAVARTEGQKAFISELQELVANYGETELGAMAKDMLAMMGQGMESKKGGATGDLAELRGQTTDDTDQTDTSDSTLVWSEDRKQPSIVLLILPTADEEALNELLYEVALFNFSQFLIRDFDLQKMPVFKEGCALRVSGFADLDEAEWWVDLVKKNSDMQLVLAGVTIQALAEVNLPLAQKKDGL